jgi:hypothetical protein
MRFDNLRNAISGLSPLEEQRIRANDFWTLVAETRLHKWSPRERVDTNGRRLLVGLAPGWSLSDLEIAELLVETANEQPDLCIDLFDPSDLGSSEELAAYIPARSSAYHTPIVGIWDKGKFVTTEEGFRGRELLAEIRKGKWVTDGCSDPQN